MESNVSFDDAIEMVLHHMLDIGANEYTVTLHTGFMASDKTPLDKVYNVSSLTDNDKFDKFEWFDTYYDNLAFTGTEKGLTVWHDNRDDSILMTAPSIIVQFTPARLQE